MNASRRPAWLPAVVAVGLVYVTVRLAFWGLELRRGASSSMAIFWRIAPWVIYSVVFVAHVGYERFRRQSSLLATAFHASFAVALGTFPLTAVFSWLLLKRGAPPLATFLQLLLLPILTALVAFGAAAAVASAVGQKPPPSSGWMMKRAGLALLLGALIVPAGAWILQARAAWSCLDRGGSYNDTTGQCDFVASHVRTSFIHRHGVLFAGSGAALILGIGLLVRGRGGALLPAARSAAERQALLLCVCVGLLALGLNVASTVGRLPPSVRMVLGGQSPLVIGTLILLDVLLVFSGGRGPRTLAIIAGMFFAASLVLLVAWMTIGALVATGMGLSDASTEEKIAFLVQWFLLWGLVAAPQWFCLRAVRDRF